MNFWKKKKNDDVNKPVVNPELKKAFNYFNLKRNEGSLEAVSLELKKATFLVLVNTTDLDLQKTEEKPAVIFEKGSIIAFLKTFDEKGNPFLPIFTDWAEIHLWVSTRKNIAGWMMQLNDVFALTLKGNYFGLVINPCSDKWEMDKNQIDTFLKESQN